MRRAMRRRSRLRRDTDEGMIAGVCAGIARHLNLRPKLVRIVAVISLIVFTVPTVVAYLLIAWLAPTRADHDAEAPVHHSARADAPEAYEAGAAEGLSRLKSRFRRLEEKFADVEAQMMNDRKA